MNKYIALTVAGFLILFSTAIAAEKPWFDLEKCAFCKTLAAEEGLIDHMTTEYHDIANGVVSVTYIDADYKEAFARAQANMAKVIEGMQKGVMPVMCTHCETMGKLYQDGCKQEGIKSRDCIIFVYTGSDSAMVTRVHDFGHKSAEATAALKAARK